MTEFALAALALIPAYVLGSCLGAKIAQALFGLPDPLRFGSGNPGASNLYRLDGIWPAVLTLVWDVGKGYTAIALAQTLGLAGWTLLAIAVAVVLGHVFPLWYGLRGGKGVATGLGATMAIAPQSTLLLVGLWWLLMARFRVPSVASLGLALCAVPVSIWLDPQATILFAILSTIVLLRHRENIRRLIKGDEKPL